MKIQKLTFLLFSAILLASCGDARFDRIPGKFQDLVPSELLGEYEFKGKDFRSQITDTLQITLTPHEIKFKTPSSSNTWAIHQNFHVYSLNRYHIIGTADQTIKGLWNLCVIEATPAGLKVYPVYENKISNEPESKISTYFPMRDLIIQHDPIIAAPSSVDGSVVPLGAGAGTPSIVKYYMVNDEQFIQFIEKELIGKEYFFLKKLVRTKEVKSKENKDLKKGNK